MSANSAAEFFQYLQPFTPSIFFIKSLEEKVRRKSLKPFLQYIDDNDQKGKETYHTAVE